MFYLHVEILPRGENRLSAGFCKRLHLDSSNYLRVTVAWPLRIHQTIFENHRESHTNVPTDHFIRTVQTEHRQAKKVCRWIGYGWSRFMMILGDSSMNTWRPCDGSAKVGAIGRDKSMKQIESRWFFSDYLFRFKLQTKPNGGYELKKVIAE